VVTYFAFGVPSGRPVQNAAQKIMVNITVLNKYKFKMRRLPIYFLVDNCLSMTGRPIEMVESCINGTLKSMKYNPQAIESNVINIFSFGNNKISILEHNKSITEIDFQKFNCSGYSNINYGLQAVKDDYNNNFIKTTTENKGDYKPMLFVFTGIAPSSKIDNILIEFFEKRFSHGFLDYVEAFVGDEFEFLGKKANFTFIVTSENSYTKNEYEKYFSNVFSYEESGSFIYKFNNFFKWVS
jgi:hypothetical protein